MGSNPIGRLAHLPEAETGLEDKPMPHHVARVTEAIAESPVSFEDALQVGFKRATETLRGITGLRVLEERASVKDNKIANFRVRFEVIFLLED
jgi:flavin-binding protein dodecin